MTEDPAFVDTDADTSIGDTGDGSSDTGEPTCPDGQPPRAWYPDADADGHGQKHAEPEIACEPPDGHVESDDDCKDDIPGVHPGAEEVCNERDDDCDGPVDGPQCGACKIQTTDESVYWICPIPADAPPISWSDARARCKSFSSRYSVDLASIHTDDEYAVITDAVQAYLKRGEDSRHHAWIGLERGDNPNSCAKPDKTKSWRWTDNSAVDHHEWNDGQPSNTTDCMCGKPDCARERCVEIALASAADQLGWNDAPCDSQLVRGFVCKTRRDPELFPGI